MTDLPKNTYVPSSNSQSPKEEQLKDYREAMLKFDQVHLIRQDRRGDPGITWKPAPYDPRFPNINITKSPTNERKRPSTEKDEMEKDEESEGELLIKPPQAKARKREATKVKKKEGERSGGGYETRTRKSRRRRDYERGAVKNATKRDVKRGAKKEEFRRRKRREEDKKRRRRGDEWERKESGGSGSRRKKSLDKESLEEKFKVYQEEMRRRKEEKEAAKNKAEEKKRSKEADKRENDEDDGDKGKIVILSDTSITPDKVIEIEMSPPILLSDEEKKTEDEDDDEEEGSREKENGEEDSESGSETLSSEEDEDEDDDVGEGEDGEGEEEEEEEDDEDEDEEESTDEVEIVENETKCESDSKAEKSPIPVLDMEIELEKDTLPSSFFARYSPALRGCRSVEEFRCLNRIEEGTYGVVYRAKEVKTNKIVALKRLKMEKEKEGFPITSLREINTLLKSQHANIVTVKEIVVGSNMDKIFIVMDYVEHDMKSLMETMKRKKRSFVASEVKCLMSQLLKAVAHLHDNWILHRDLKTSNLLFSHSGVLKVGDFGLAREYGSPLKNYTPVVVTLWYRAPELLLGTKKYSTAVDMWSVGCIFAEFLKMEPLFPGKHEVDQLGKIFKALGTPTEAEWPDYPKFPVVQKANFADIPPHAMRPTFVPSVTSDIGYDLLSKLLTYNPDVRVTAEDAMEHAYFSEAPKAIDPAMFPTFPAKSELGSAAHAVKTMCSPKPPSGGQNYKDMFKDQDEEEGFYIGVNDRPLQSTFSLKF